MIGDNLFYCYCFLEFCSLAHTLNFNHFLYFHSPDFFTSLISFATHRSLSLCALVSYNKVF
uniref:Uncharacterized protein n=1 Tax=Rhizophora mucronata TaxID=61149 RepID=A0A2P2NGQ3_RHIMU